MKTTHYRATYDLVELYRSRGAVTNEATFEKFLDLFSSTAATSEAWVDGDGLVRRTVDTSSLKTGPQTAKAEFFDFGVEVNATVPAATDTFTLTDMAALAAAK